MPTQEPKCSSQGWRTSEHRQRGKHWNQETKKINKQIEDPVEHGKCHSGDKVCFREVETLTSVSRWWPGRGLVGRKATLRLVSSWWIQSSTLMPFWHLPLLADLKPRCKRNFRGRAASLWLSLVPQVHLTTIGCQSSPGFPVNKVKYHLSIITRVTWRRV